MENTKAAALFFNPGMPPPPLPVLTSHTDLHSLPVATATILSHEELPRPESTGVRTTIKRSGSKRVRVNMVSNSDDDAPSNSDHMPQASDGGVSDSASDGAPEGPKIAKPVGEAGRPGRGGYNLQDALGWRTNDYRSLKVMWCPRSGEQVH